MTQLLSKSESVASPKATEVCDAEIIHKKLNAAARAVREGCPRRAAKLAAWALEDLRRLPNGRESAKG